MILLSVCMTTYNQEKYIAQAIESALMQKTNFDFEIVIGEDCSTDRTKEIVANYARKYPDKIKSILNERNIGIIPNFVNTLNNCSGKYIAILDGDDYWTDPYKLQKQVDFLEANPDYGVVHSAYDVWYEQSCKLIKSANKNMPSGNVYEELLIGNFICTSTVCIRKIIIDKVIEELGSNFYKWKQGDQPLWIGASLLSKIAYISDPMAVHQILLESAQNTQNKKKEFEFFQSTYDVRFYFIKKYGCPEKIEDMVYRNYYIGILRYSYYLRDYKLADEAYSKLKEKNHPISLTDTLKYLSTKNYFLWIIIKFMSEIKLIIRS